MEIVTLSLSVFVALLGSSIEGATLLKPSPLMRASRRAGVPLIDRWPRSVSKSYNISTDLADLLPLRGEEKSGCALGPKPL